MAGNILGVGRLRVHPTRFCGMTVDLLIIGAGPAGSAAAITAAQAGLKVLMVEKSAFPREKVCGDCLNPSLWPVLESLQVAEQVRALPHTALRQARLQDVRGRSVEVPLGLGKDPEIAVKRSDLDLLLLQTAREAGAEAWEACTPTRFIREKNAWKIETSGQTVTARFLIAADGRNSTTARLLGLMPQAKPDRVGLQSHIPLAAARATDQASTVTLRLLPGGYAGIAPVGEGQLNVCLVGRAASLPALRAWAAAEFQLADDHAWRSITPLSRAAIKPAHSALALLLAGDTARVVEPFTGEGIYYALQSGRLAALAICDSMQTDDKVLPAFARYAREHAALYRDRLWVNHLARLAVTAPTIGNALFALGRWRPEWLGHLSAKLVTGQTAAAP